MAAIYAVWLLESPRYPETSPASFGAASGARGVCRDHADAAAPRPALARGVEALGGARTALYRRDACRLGGHSVAVWLDAGAGVAGRVCLLSPGVWVWLYVG